MSQHAKGPLKAIRLNDTDGYAVDFFAIVPADPSRQGNVGTVEIRREGGWDDLEEAEAYARLFVAAPNLLAALLAIKAEATQCDRYLLLDFSSDEYKGMLAAIAEAEGVAT